MRLVLPIALLLASATPSLAQVTVDLRALETLPSASPSARSAPQRPAPRHAPPASAPSASATTTQRAETEKPPSETSGQTASAGGSAAAPTVPAPAPSVAPPAPPPAATLPTTAPPVAHIEPVPPPPTPASAAPPPSPPIEANASTTAAATSTGLRIAFTPGGSDLSPASADAIKRMVGDAQKDEATYNVVGYAAATPDDPSMARRLSLARALAVRNAIMADGVGSSRIYVRALGAQNQEGPPDRVDVSLLGGNAPPSQTR